MIVLMQNQELPKLDELYKEIILEHYREPCGKVPLEHVDYEAEGMNPLCGDEVKLSLQLKDKTIEKIHIEGHGCSISVASGSMLASILKGKSINEAKQLSLFLKDMMHGKVDKNEKDIGDLEALEGVKKFPVRIKCALLPWTTFEEALAGHEHVEIS
ncbi:MAG: SUF system NifU family Fe-S cluster assembly protein [Candidatus Melainabacteria bacterium]|nr:SUF system NifU family Fe-S cluster assembly protein [Candidatus Melainabacteria bacterium]MBI3309017.1 SUF system NifU family Fe-S cluster assembly protein [Candidatus Melainabacteria bacterium]